MRFRRVALLLKASKRSSASAGNSALRDLQMMRLDDGVVDLLGDELERTSFLNGELVARTKQPLPATVSITRWLSSSAYALATVLRLTRSSSASGRIEGSGSPGGRAGRRGGFHLVDQLQVDEEPCRT
jgi:hypothetical protein